MSDDREGVAAHEDESRFSPIAHGLAPLTLERVRTALAPRYVIERELGAGGTSIVYLAHDRTTGGLVAVKMLRPELSAAVVAARFLREVRLGERLAHKHILPILESGVADTSLYLTTPFVEGETLQRRLKREVQLSIGDTLALARAVASALDYAHANDVIHRDIKPANILLGTNGDVLVADFGIGRAMTAASSSELTESGTVIGTALYMSPEQGSGSSQLTGRSDVYSLACVVYEMLAGEPPFTGPNAQAIIARAFREEPRALNVVRTTVTPAMDRVVAKALAKVPSDRYATAGEFIRALEQAATDRSGAQSAAWPSRALRRVPRRALAVATVAVVTIASAVTFALRGAKAPATSAPLYLAIRPFSSDSANFGWLGAALEAKLGASLFEAPGLALRSATAVAPYASRSLPDDSLARLVGADLLLDGRIVVSSDSVGVTVQFIDAKTSTVLDVEHLRVPKGLTAESLLDSASLRLRTFLLPAIGREVRSRSWMRGSRDTTTIALFFAAHDRRVIAEALIDDDPRAALDRFHEADSLLALAILRDKAWDEPRLARAGLAARRAWAARTVVDVSAVGAILDTGIVEANAVLARAPSSAEALAYRGRLHWRKYLWGTRDFPAALVDSAEVDLRAAASARTPIAFAAQDLSEVLYMDRMRFAEAREWALLAYRLDSFLDDTGLLINRVAMSSLNLGDDVEADKWCRQGARQYPNQPMHVACLLDVMAWGTQPPSPDSARALYRVLTARNSTGGVRWHYLLRVAAVLARAKQGAEARSLVAQVRKEMTDAKANRQPMLPWEAGVFFRMGDTTEGQRLFEEYRAVLPADAQIRATGYPLRGFVAPPAKGSGR